MSLSKLSRLTIGIKGAGEMASGVAWRLHRAGFKKIFMLEVPNPLAVRRRVSFCEAIHLGGQTVEGIAAARVDDEEAIRRAWLEEKIAVLDDPGWATIEKLKPDVLVDAILAKKNLGTTRNEARLVIGLGPGFIAGGDVHLVVETNRGHHLGRIIEVGRAEPNTGIPGAIGGETERRVLRSPRPGVFQSDRSIGDLVEAGETVGTVDSETIRSEISGVIRGLIRPGVSVSEGLKLGDIDPRGDLAYCDTISEKSRAIGGSVLEAILRIYNQ